jgi:hypothetical protein
MQIKQVLRMAFVILTCTSFSYGWQNQPAATTRGNTYPAATSRNTLQQQYQAVPQYGGLSQPPPQYQPQQSGGAASAPYPQYPYPRYHNPYYSSNGMTPRNMLSNTMEWLINLPSNFADRVSNFVDNRFFPRTPATHGGQPQSQIQRAIPSGGNSIPQQTSTPPGTSPAVSR